MAVDPSSMEIVGRVANGGKTKDDPRDVLATMRHRFQ